MENNNTENNPSVQPSAAQPDQQAYQQPYAQPYQQPGQQQYQQPGQQQYQPPYQSPYQQPVQQAYQQPYQQMPPQYTAPAYPAGQQLSELDMMTPQERSERNKKATILCIISLGLHFLPEVLTGAFSAIVEEISKTAGSGSFSDMYAGITSILLGGTYIASWVLMIMARVKYKENKFAKILMWVYIAILAVSILAVILIIAMCAYIIKDCQGF